MPRSQKIIDEWIKDGLFEMESDGATKWTDFALSQFTPAERMIAYYIPYEGMEQFNHICKISGHKPETILRRFCLDENGFPYTD